MAGRWSWDANELQEILSDVLVEGTQHQPVVIFIDALNECGEAPARDLLAFFNELMRKVMSNQAQVKICLSSRHYPILCLENIQSIFVEERNHEDIRHYVRRQEIFALKQNAILSKTGYY